MHYIFMELLYYVTVNKQEPTIFVMSMTNEKNGCENFVIFYFHLCVESLTWSLVVS